MGILVYDIETGPLPWAEIEPLYAPPEKLPPWDDGMVKYGQTKDPAKRAEKFAEVKAAYDAKLAAEAAAIAEHKAQWAREAALSPVTGRVLAIGVRSERGQAIVGNDAPCQEADILSDWWSLYRKHNDAHARFVGYCSNFFDFPFLVWRSYKLEIPVPESAWDKTGRYPAYSFVDLMDRLPKRGFSDESRKLGDICRWLGIGAKPDGVDGGMFASLWGGSPEDHQQAAEYLLNDLDMTWRLAERMGVI